MPNNLLTLDEITREALMIFHQKATFIGSINRQYDDSFAKTGAKIGDTLRIRMPNQYTVEDGAEIVQLQDTEEQKIDLRVQKRKKIALSFTSEERSLKLDDFSKRVLEPAVSVLVSNVEADVINSLFKRVPSQVDQNGTAFTFDTLLAGREVLNNKLCPDDGRRTAVLSARHGRKLANDLKANQNPAGDISGLIRDGYIGRVASFGDIYESSHIINLTTGTAAEGDTSYLSNQVLAQDNTESIVVDTGSTTFKEGEILEFEDVFEVHPETKVVTERLMQFVLTADVAANATLLPISPKLVATGARQNVSAGLANNKKVYKRGAGNGQTLNMSLAYHPNFATFVTADLAKPHSGEYSIKQKDGISMRLWQDSEIRSDLHITRLDIMYGSTVLRGEMATRLHADG